MTPPAPAIGQHHHHHLVNYATSTSIAIPHHHHHHLVNYASTSIGVAQHHHHHLVNDATGTSIGVVSNTTLLQPPAPTSSTCVKCVRVHYRCCIHHPSFSNYLPAPTTLLLQLPY